ncbi:hypothetical protein CEXT_216561 [Caerostris extrusa]|uniref:Deubiquitinating enzyme MINDY-3/4 conserved domain-containing protein n=1 Tax=Caerostris extrusa TaxID=172846 RepID=A0AAV4QM53_CAEEX|nr:hypothetical protein CEXT_216561 [Caerostris extrusa]
MLADSHFTVLFTTSKRYFEKRRLNEPFILYHYDGLAKRHAETSYTIEPLANSSPIPKDKTLPVVIRCIHTRWPLAAVEINTNEENNSD